MLTDVKVCVKCKIPKPLTEFSKRYNGTQSYCVECARLSSREHYNTNPDKYKKRTLDRVASLLEWLRGIKNNLSCGRCGEEHIATLDFHHKDTKTKIGSIADLICKRRSSKKRILEEIDKCEVICSNCHRKEHYKERIGPSSKGRTRSFELLNRGSNP